MAYHRTNLRTFMLKCCRLDYLDHFKWSLGKNIGPSRNVEDRASASTTWRDRAFSGLGTQLGLWGTVPSVILYIATISVIGSNSMALLLSAYPTMAGTAALYLVLFASEWEQ